jgi:hypothetical protein
MTNSRRAFLVGAVTLAVAAAGCGGGTQPLAPSNGTTAAAGPSGLAASPSAAALVAPSADLSEFDGRFSAAVETAKDVPLAGLPPSGTVTPECQALGEPTSPSRFCIAQLPAADPIVTIMANATGSMGATGLMMAYAAMPDGIRGTVLPAPALGDEASSARSWGDQGCTAVLAVRDGTLIVSVQVRLANGAAAVDCGLDAPTDYLETVARTLLDNLGAFRAVGLPVDDPAARDRAARLITDGTLRPGERDLVTLPPEFASLSDSGEVIARRDADGWTIVFFEVRGLVDHYSGWVFRSTGKLGADEDPLGGGSATVERIDEHWFHVASN